MFDSTKNLTKQVWWLVLLTGIAGTILGLITLFWPGLTLKLLVYIFAIFTIVGGIVGLFEALVSIRKDRLWWLMLLFALLNLGIGVFLLRNPLVTAVIFVALLAITVFAQAIFDLMVASYMHKQEGKWLWILGGILGLITGLVILFYPLASSLAFVWVLGLYALIHGIMAVAYAIQIRGDVKKLKKA